MAAAIAQVIRLCLPTCCPGFESQAQFDKIDAVGQNCIVVIGPD